VFSFTVPGRPVPAVRMTQKGKFVNKQAIRYLGYKQLLGWAAVAAGVKKSERLIKIDIRAFRCGGQDCDWDNIAKSACDALNQIAYIDDKQIIDGRCRKFFCQSKDQERLEIDIEEVD